MSFAETGNGNAVNFYQSSSAFISTFETIGVTNKVAELIVFPNIDGRDAPGKTGSAAKPALVREVGLFVYPGDAQVVRIGVWSSTGTNFTGSANYTMPNTSSLKRLEIPARPVLSGSSYWVGFSIMDLPSQTPGVSGVLYAVNSITTLSTHRYDTTPFTTSSNFFNQAPGAFYGA